MTTVTMTKTSAPTLEQNVKSGGVPIEFSKEGLKIDPDDISVQTSDNVTATKQVEVKSSEPADMKGAVDAQVLSEKLEIVANQKAEADRLK
jgi:hypothetical protein